MPTPIADTKQALGVVAATAKLSRRQLVVEFRAIYVVRKLRGTSISNALVHFALMDVEKQTEEIRMELSARQAASGGSNRRQAAVPWATDQRIRMDDMRAVVVLPHCMQTSASFWGRVGFNTGKLVDKQEQKQATLNNKSGLKGEAPQWLSLIHI